MNIKHIMLLCLMVAYCAMGRAVAPFEVTDSLVTGPDGRLRIVRGPSTKDTPAAQRATTPKPTVTVTPIQERPKATIATSAVQYDNPTSKTLHRVDREIQNAVFVPKGTWMGGGSISYNEHKESNLNYLVIKDVDAKGYTFGVSPYFGYFIKNNMALGMRFNYNRTNLDLGNFDLNLGEDFNINLRDIKLLEHKYETSAFLRTYMQLGASKVFGFFSEARVTYGYCQSRNSTGSLAANNFDGTYATANTLHIGFAPGMTAFVNDWMACEVQLGVMGFGFKWQDQITNQVEQGSQRTMTGQFKIDLFSISIGTTIYL